MWHQTTSFDSPATPAGRFPRGGIEGDVLARLVRVAPSDIGGTRSASQAAVRPAGDGLAACPGGLSLVEDPVPPVRPAAGRVLRADRRLVEGTRPAGVVASCDAKHRVSIKKLTCDLGWDQTTDLVLDTSGDHAVLSPGVATAQTAWLIPVRLDPQDRLSLPSATRAVLGLEPGDAVMLASSPTQGRVYLWPLVDVVATLTGVGLASQCDDAKVAGPGSSGGPEQPPGRPIRRSRVKRARFA